MVGERTVGSSGSVGSVGNSIQVALEDFPHIVKAVEIFQRLYHQKKIPSNFVVPEFAEWPEEMHGFRLGKRLEKILSTKSFFTQYPDKVKQLSLVLGIESALSLQNTLTDDWFIVLDAMKAYDSIYGDLRIPPNFVVPHQEPWPKLAYGLKLGARVSAIRNVGRYVKDYPQRKEILDALGFDWRGRDQIRSHEEEQLFQKICQAITIYKQTFQSVVIPASYVVPAKSKDFPPSLRGLPLGKHIHQIKYENKLIVGHPERVNQLHSLGVHLKYDEPSMEVDDRRQKEARLISSALKEYRKQYGRSPVPRSFIVPNQLPWPREAWGMLLGEKVAEINANAAMIATAPRKNRRKIGGGFLDSYMNEGSDGYKDLLIQEETPPLIDEEIDEYAGEDGQRAEDEEELALSSLKQSLTSESSTVKKNPNYNPFFEEEVESFNPFKINSLPPYREMAAEAFNRFEEDYIESGDIRQRRYRVFQNFLDINGLNKIMYKTPSAEHIQHMRKMGYRILEFDQYYWEDVVLGLKLFKRLFGHLDVSANFVIDEKVLNRLSSKKERKQYMDLVGLKLGEYVIDLRVGDVDGFEDPERRKILDELGFIWGDPLKYLRFRFPAMASALQMYLLYFGSTTMDETFVIPDTPIWPEWMIGMELGKWCAIAKIQQNVLRRFYPERHQILSDMGFTWWLGFMSYYDDYCTPPK